MGDILYWIIFIGVLTFAMKFFTKRWNSKTPKEDLLTDQEVAARENEKFPFWYHLYYPVFIVVMIGGALGLVLLSWYFLTHYPQWILAGKSYIALSSNPWGMYLMLIVFFPGLVWGALLMSPLDRIFPGLVRYVEKNQLKQWGLRTKSNAKSLTKQYVKFAVITTAIALPLIFLAADNYYYVDQEAFHYNSFLGFSEQSIPLTELEKVGVGAWPNNGKNASGINWEYILIFQNGEKYNMKEAGLTELKNLDDFLIQRNIAVEVTTAPNDKAMAWINTSGSQSLKDLFQQAFNPDRLKK